MVMVFCRSWHWTIIPTSNRFCQIHHLCVQLISAILMTWSNESSPVLLIINYEEPETKTASAYLLHSIFWHVVMRIVSFFHSVSCGKVCCFLRKWPLVFCIDIFPSVTGCGKRRLSFGQQILVIQVYCVVYSVTPFNENEAHVLHLAWTIKAQTIVNRL